MNWLIYMLAAAMPSPNLHKLSKVLVIEVHEWKL